MPVRVEKKGEAYQVRTPGGVKAKGTTKGKAKAQEKLLNAIEHGFKPGKKLPEHRMPSGEMMAGKKHSRPMPSVGLEGMNPPGKGKKVTRKKKPWLSRNR